MAVPYYLNKDNGRHYIINGRLVVPEGVIQIEENAFSGNNDIREIIMPESLTVIDDGAFENCKEICKVQFSRNLIDIGYYTFKNCRRLAYVDLSECRKLWTINDGCFESAEGLEKVLLPPELKAKRSAVLRLQVALTSEKSLQNVRLKWRRLDSLL